MSSGRLPPGMEEFGHRLREAAAREAEAHSRRPRRRRTRGYLLAAGATLLVAGAAAGASGVFDGNGPPLPSKTDIPKDLRPDADAGVVPSLAIADPAGGPPWSVRVFTNSRGEDCVVLGRLRDGHLGQVINGHFRRSPKEAPGLCADLTRRQLLFGVESRQSPLSRTIVYGLAPQRQPIVATLAGHRRRITPRAFGAFVIVFDRFYGPKPQVVLRTTINGRPVVRTLGS